MAVLTTLDAEAGVEPAGVWGSHGYRTLWRLCIIRRNNSLRFGLGFIYTPLGRDLWSFALLSTLPRGGASDIGRPARLPFVP